MSRHHIGSDPDNPNHVKEERQPTIAITPSGSGLDPENGLRLGLQTLRRRGGCLFRGMEKLLHFEESGGEGGIRTLGTGVSPYNGLARHFHPKT